MSDLKRRVELMLCGALESAIPKSIFEPSEGGGDREDAQEIEPPFGIISIEEDDKMMATEGTWMMHGKVVWVTRMSETSVPEHSEQVGAMYRALAALKPGVDADRRVVFHGIDVGSAGGFDDDGRKAHGDTFEFSCGISEMV